MWDKGGEFMVNDQGNYTPIPAGTATVGLYWEDQIGLIKSVSLEGTGRSAKIKVLVNKTKEGNAVIYFKVNGIIYWSWHVWVTDDPTIDGSTYHHGFEKDKNGNLVTNWKWMDRNLGATNARLVGHDMFLTKGLQYEWGRKDPFPVSKITGEAGKFTPGISQKNPIPIKFRGNVQPADSNGNLHNTGSDLPNGNVRYSINNPIHYIVAPTYIYKIGEPVVQNGENFLRQGPGVTTWSKTALTTWFSKQKLKIYDKNDYYQNVFYDLWGDTRGGKWSNYNTREQVVAEESRRYSMKSPYDPCPCGWRVPSFYSTVSCEHQASPWGLKHTNSSTDFTPDAPNADYPGIKVYPSYGFDFTGVSNRNLGVIPVNGNYEYYPQTMQMGDGLRVNRNSEKLFLGFYADRNGPICVYQDFMTDGGLHTSTFNTAYDIVNMGSKGLGIVNDAGNTANHSPIGWYHLSHAAQYGTTYDSAGVRCILDPNNVYMSNDFETEYVTSPPTTYTPEKLRLWTKDPNSYVACTDPTQVTIFKKVIDIPLRKAFAMHKLYYSANNDFPIGTTKSSSVVWTTDQTLISKLEITDGPIDAAILRVTLNENRFGNAVVAFHLGNTGWTTNNNPDPIVWSWHIWAPQNEIKLHPTYTTESFANGGMRPDNSGQFVNAVHSIYGVPMNTTVMDRDLGAQIPFIDHHYQADYLNFKFETRWPGCEQNLRALAIRASGGLHYQWGRKDPIPVFYYPGGFYDHSAGGVVRDNFRRYSVYKQTGLNNGNIVYGVAIDENNYLANYSKEYSTYSVSSDVTPTDSTFDKVKKVLKYSVANPFSYMYQNKSSNSFDWISNENGLYEDRWGHGTEKSPFDPCPAGFRIPDTQWNTVVGVNLYDSTNGAWYHPFPKGNSPWFYNARFVQNNKTVYGIDPSNGNYYVNYEPYDTNRMNYLGGYVRATGLSAMRFGFVFNNPGYNIGNYPNNAVRGLNGGNMIEEWARSGIWTSASLSPTDDYAIGMIFNTEITRDAGNLKLFYFASTHNFRPQSAMSCRCAKIEYDEAGKEIGRYDPSKM